MRNRKAGIFAERLRKMNSEFSRAAAAPRFDLRGSKRSMEKENSQRLAVEVS